MRHIIVALLATAFLVTSTCSSALAQNLPADRQDATPTSTRREKAKEKSDRLATKAADRREAIKERLDEHKERLATKAAALKERLAQFKDKRKAATVERVNATLQMINEKRTDAMRKHLDTMTKLLTKLSDRVAKKKAEGKDTSQADAAIASASASIASASAAVDAQALKDYTISVSSESGVRTDAKKVRDALHADLQAVRKLVIEAKQSVAAAIRVAATTLGGIGNGN